MLREPLSACPVTGVEPEREFLRLDRVPVQTSVLASNAGEARSLAFGAIRLAVDPTTGHVWNRAFDADALRFVRDAAHESPGDAELEAEAADVAERLKLNATSRVLEIGCGDGSFLKALCDVAGCDGVGYDPAYTRRDLGGNVVAVAAAFTDETVSAIGTVDAIVLRDVLPFVPQPGRLLRVLRTLLGDTGGRVYLTVPNAEHLVARGCVWDIDYERPNLFTPSSLGHLLADGGFNSDVGETAGPMLRLVSSPGSGSTPASEAEAMLQAAGAFEERYYAAVAEWSARLDGWFASGRDVGLWGCGPRAVSLLTRCDPTASRVQLCVDPDPRRVGKFLPGTGHAVRPTYELGDLRPHVLIVTRDQDVAAAEAALPGVEICVLPETASVELL